MTVRSVRLSTSSRGTTSVSLRRLNRLVVGVESSDSHPKFSKARTSWSPEMSGNEDGGGRDEIRPISTPLRVDGRSARDASENPPVRRAYAMPEKSHVAHDGPLDLRL